MVHNFLPLYGSNVYKVGYICAKTQLETET